MTSLYDTWMSRITIIICYNSQCYPLQVLVVGETFPYDSIALYDQTSKASSLDNFVLLQKEKDKMTPEHGSGTKKAITSQKGIELAGRSSSCGYVTFLAGNGDYVKGVVGLAKGLIKAKSMYPLVVAIFPDVPEEHRMLLRSHGCIMREIEPLAPSLQSSDKYARSYYVLNYSKLRIWQVRTIYICNHHAMLIH